MTRSIQFSNSRISTVKSPAKSRATYRSKRQNQEALQQHFSELCRSIATIQLPKPSMPEKSLAGAAKSIAPDFPSALVNCTCVTQISYALKGLHHVYRRRATSGSLRLIRISTFAYPPDCRRDLRLNTTISGAEREVLFCDSLSWDSLLECRSQTLPG
jgi:hypothetical protein